MGRDGPLMQSCPRLACFNPRAPMGRDCHARAHWYRYAAGFNPRAPMGRDTLAGINGATSLPVSTHAPLWGATNVLPMYFYAALGFNPRAPMGRDSRTPLTATDGCEFQPTRPYGARLAGALTKVSRSLVSTHAPLWGATRFSRAISATSSSFNPRAPMGRDAEPRSRRLCVVVSTHAPLWGATAAVGKLDIASLVSTHAPLWGATTPPPHRRRPSGRFNPRAPMGRDVIQHEIQNYAKRFQPTRPYGARPRPRGRRAAISPVSTHAPLWGATCRHPTSRGCRRPGFNPRAPMGRDLYPSAAATSFAQFQPTRPYGARRTHRIFSSSTLPFQPTRPYGARRWHLSYLCA